MIKKIIALMLMILMVASLVACGDGESGSEVLITSTAPASAVTPAPSSSSMPEEVVLNQAFLTGLEKDEDYPEGKRITAVMINNVPSSRPQNGISEAEILVEIGVEYGVTRFMAIFEDYEDIPEVGGLRSARDQFFQLLIPFRGFYVHEGPSHSSHPVNVMINDYEYEEYDLQATYYPIYEKDSSRSTDSYGWYDVSGESITEHIESRELDDYRSYGSPMFNFVSYEEEPRVPETAPMPELTITHNPGYLTYFEYDNSSEKYMMSMFNSYSGNVDATIDNNNGEQLGFENVLVLFAPVDTYPNTAPENLPKYNYADGGYGYYFSQGHYEPLYWRKGAPNEALMLEKADGSGEPFYINTGKTYLSMVNDENLPAFDEMMKSGAASEYAESGQVNTEGEEPVD